MIKTVLFDLDGTLLNTIDDLADAGNWVCTQNGWPTFTVEQFKHMVGNGIPKLVERFSPEDARSQEQLAATLAQFSARYDAHKEDKTAPYAGISELCRLSENQSYRLAVCIPMTDYCRLIFSGNLQMLLIGLFILFFVVFCCMYFHQHILSPAFRQFEEDRRESRRRMDELQMERQQMQTELSRLADVCRNESVPDAFQTFLEGIPNLTKTERRIFDGYVAGLRSREIVEQ